MKNLTLVSRLSRLTRIDLRFPINVPYRLQSCLTVSEINSDLVEKRNFFPPVYFAPR